MQLDDLRTAVVAIALIAFIGAAAAIGLNDVKVSETVYGDTEVNESVTATGSTALSHDFVEDGSLTVYNDTVLYTEGINYTVNYTSGVVHFVKTGGVYNVSYTHRTEDAFVNITENGEVGVVNTTDYLDTIGTILGVAVLIGIVMLAFSFVRR